MRSRMALVLAAILTAGAAEGASAQKYVTIGSSGAGGTYNIIAAAIAKVVNDHADGIQMNVEATPGGGLGNIRLLGQEKLDFGIGTAADAVAAWRGTPPFEKKKLGNLRTVLIGTDLPFHLVVPGDSEIRSVADLKGKKIVTNSSANALTFVPDALAAYGLKKGVDYTLTNYSTTEAVEAFKDGRVAAFASFFFMPATPIVDVGTTKDIRLVSMEPDKVEKLVKSHEIYSRATIPGGTYPHQSEAVPTASILVAIYAHEKTPAETVYKVTKVILEYSKELEAIYKPAASFSLDQQKQQLARHDIVPPLHEGVSRYLREAKALP